MRTRAGACRHCARAGATRGAGHPPTCTTQPTCSSASGKGSARPTSAGRCLASSFSSARTDERVRGSGWGGVGWGGGVRVCVCACVCVCWWGRLLPQKRQRRSCERGWGHCHRAPPPNPPTHPTPNPPPLQSPTRPPTTLHPCRPPPAPPACVTGISPRLAASRILVPRSASMGSPCAVRGTGRTTQALAAAAPPTKGGAPARVF